MKGFLIAIVLFLPFTSDAQRYEAENATLSGGATKQSSQARSGGQFVAQNEGSLTWTVSIATEGFYRIILNAAAPDGDKVNVFSIGDNAMDFSSSGSAYSSTPLVSSLRMPAGTHTVKISKSWGYINIDFIEFQRVSSDPRFAINEQLVTPAPIDNVLRLYQFLRDNYGRRIISGVMTLNTFDETAWLKTNTGKEPALIGLDFMHSGRNYNWYNDKQPIEDAKAYYERNGIPAICWHWRDPSRATEEFYTTKTAFDVSKVFEPTSPEYLAIIADIDYISGLLKELHNANVPVIWRPLHEAAGGWFWWGAKGPEPCKKLFQVMYDRMVNHHGLKNLIWVWTREPNDNGWYPGDAYVDIVGRDLYKDGVHSSHALEWNAMNEVYGKKKLITLSECGSFPDPDNLATDGAAWSWFMPWYGSFVRDAKYNSLDLWKKTMNHEYVITLDEMPDLKTYEAVVHPPAPEPDPILSVELIHEEDATWLFPTIVTDRLYIESKHEIGPIRVYNAAGVELQSLTAKSTNAIISFASEGKGMYFVKIRNRPAVKVFKR
ncbi:MAG TPA: glycosyl hydrolase [Chryseosolibacter sp.]